MPRPRAAPIVALILLFMVGCAGYGIRKEPTEKERQLNHQNQGAGEYVQTRAEELGLPDLSSAGSDVVANSKTLAISPVGEPEDPQPYTPEKSEQLREEVEDEAESPWWGGLLTTGGIATAGAIALRIAGRFAPSLLGPAGGALAAVVEGIEAFRGSADPADQPKIAALLSQLKESQEKAGYREHVTRVVRKVRNGHATSGSLAQRT